MPEISKTHQLRNGFPYREYATDGAPPYNRHGAYQNKAGDWLSIRHMENGQYKESAYGTSDYDLVEIPPKVDFYVNIYSGVEPVLHLSLKSAKECAYANLIDCIHISGSAGGSYTIESVLLKKI